MLSQLAASIPGWSDSKALSRGRYLGVVLGPQSLDLSWVALSAKFFLRVDIVARCRFSVSFSILAHNTYAARTDGLGTARVVRGVDGAPATAWGLAQHPQTRGVRNPWVDPCLRPRAYTRPHHPPQHEASE